MKKYSIEEIQKKYNTLPPNVKEVYESAETAEALQQIGKEHGLMLDKLGELADETGLIILGLTHPKDYINNLAERLSIEKEEAKNIAEKVNQKVFQKIREELKKMHGIEEATETTPPIKMPEAIKPPIIKPEIKTEEKPKATPPTALPKMPTPNINAPLIAPASQPDSPAPKIEVMPVPVIKPPVPAIPQPPSPVSPFEQKLHEEEILRSTIETAPRYTGKDPYREPTD